ncbi:hypothetical protein IM40_08985 [Candidatus Paracaedimonas acanthamoebae]|nr:hypothetical protein IM40_08985 [Candidatus Paracaedimonas acanthamoebae]
MVFRFKSQTLIFFTALYYVLFLNISLWKKIVNLSDFSSLSVSLFFISLWGAYFLALNIFFNFLFLPYIARPLMSLITLLSALVSYSMDTLGIQYDTEMIRNIFHTDAKEALELINFKSVMWFFGFGIIPASLLWLVKIDYGKPLWRELRNRIVNVLLSFALLCVIGLVFYKEYSVSFRMHKSLKYLINPTNYIFSTIKYSKSFYQPKKSFMPIGLDAHKSQLGEKLRKKVLLIVVIGETARSQNFSLNGYHVETNPLLAQKKVISLKNVSSSGTSTAFSLPCMFSRHARKDCKADIAQTEEGLLDILSRAGFKVLWKENNSGCKGVCDRIPTQKLRENLRENEESYDENLLEGLQEYINQLQGDAVIFLHQMGSHGPAYYKRYPKPFKRFTPTCETNQIESCGQSELINTYDNSILYTDYVLSKVIDLLQANPQFYTGMMYVSDHGESLGEKGIYLHGAPYVIAPKEQTHIPWIIWFSDEFIKDFHLDLKRLKKDAEVKSYSHDNLFHSLLGLLHISTQVYDKKLDIFLEN